MLGPLQLHVLARWQCILPQPTAQGLWLRHTCSGCCLHCAGLHRCSSQQKQCVTTQGSALLHVQRHSRGRLAPLLLLCLVPRKGRVYCRRQRAQHHGRIHLVGGACWEGDRQGGGSVRLKKRGSRQPCQRRHSGAAALRMRRQSLLVQPAPGLLQGTRSDAASGLLHGPTTPPRGKPPSLPPLPNNRGAHLPPPGASCATPAPPAAPAAREPACLHALLAPR